MALFGKKKNGKRTIRRRVKRPGQARSTQLLARLRQAMLGLAFLVGCVAISIAVAALGQTSHHFLARSGYFRIERVELAGGVDKELKAEMFELTGLDHPEQLNLLTLDAERLREELLLHPKTRDVTVAKKYPRTLTIVASEREPVAIVSSAGLHAIDREAIVLGETTVRVASKERLPYITGVPESEIVLGRRLKSDGVDHALDLIAALKAKNNLLLRKLSEIHLSREEGLTVFLTGGTEARFGVGPPTDKLAHLEYYLERRPDTRETQYVDLRFNKLIISKPTEPGNR